MSKKNASLNSHCPVHGCKTETPHTDDPVVAELIEIFSPPDGLAHWSWVAMVDLRDSIIRDIQEGRLFAWQTRIRQVEEIYFKALYCAFFAVPAELPHIFSGAMPNSIMPMYRKVNAEILQGNGRWEVPQEASPDSTPVKTLHSAAHASYAAIFSAISASKYPESLEELKGQYIKHLNTYCDRLEYMRDIFAAARDKRIVLEAFRNMHRPASYWQERNSQNAEAKRA